MPRNEEGEFELVVGNRQLMALLFVLFSVCGVVFGIGYWIGKNAAPETQEVAASSKPSPGGLPDAQALPEPAGPPVETAPLPQAAADVPLPPGEAKVTSATQTTPVGGETAPPPAEVKPQPVPETKPTPPPKPAPAKPVETAKAPAPQPPPSAGPRPGERYLQIAAVKRAEAEIVADAIKKRGFHAITAPATPNQPADGLWRVLVGPVGDNTALAKIRADLQAAGFKQVFVQKY